MSVITAIVNEPNGTAVSDGTVILFFTTIGRIDREGKTKDGIARVNFTSDSRSGTARITALSGGPAGSGGGVTPSPNPSASPTAPPAGGGSGQGEVDVEVGNIRVSAIRLRADPPRITTSNSTHVFALVVDGAGNPIANVPVYFQVLPDNTTTTPTSTTTTTTPPMRSVAGSSAASGPETEFFDISGPVFTNNNGEAENVMRTRRETVGTALVRAQVPAAGGFKSSEPLAIPIL